MATATAPQPDAVKLPTIALYIVNQTKQPMQEVWVGYAVKKKKKAKDGTEKKTVVEQNFFVSSPILVGPTPIFIANIEVHAGKKGAAVDDADSSSNDVDSSSVPNEWKLYWRNEGNSINGLAEPLIAKVVHSKGLVSLYVVEKQVKVNQKGTTVSGGTADWDTLLHIPKAEAESEGDVVDEPASDAEATDA